MQTTRLVLKVPFMRYPAGTVFELEDNLEYDGWEEDDRLREKLNFTDKRIFALPDGGRGFATSLPASYTQACPPEAFENTDLCRGPCRITKVESGSSCGQMNEESVSLVDIDGYPAQGIDIQLPEGRGNPLSIVLLDSLRGTELKEFTVLQSGATLNFSGLFPGFFQLQIAYPNDCTHRIRFIKSFPLLIFFIPGSHRYTTQKTLY